VWTLGAQFHFDRKTLFAFNTQRRHTLGGEGKQQKEQYKPPFCVCVCVCVCVWFSSGNILTAKVALCLCVPFLFLLKKTKKLKKKKPKHFISLFVSFALLDKRKESGTHTHEG
jgi:hypothetical protein